MFLMLPGPTQGGYPNSRHCTTFPMPNYDVLAKKCVRIVNNCSVLSQSGKQTRTSLLEITYKIEA